MVYRISSVIFIILFSIATLSTQTVCADLSLIHKDPAFQALGPDALDDFLKNLQKDPVKALDPIDVSEPFDKTLVPSDMASIAFSWEDDTKASAWVLTIHSDEGRLLTALLDKTWWIPQRQIWESLKKRSQFRMLSVHLLGIGGWSGHQILSEGRTRFAFSRDPLDASVMFMRKPIPFKAAKAHPELTHVVVGDISAYERPKPVTSNLKTCANCHSYSLNGKTFAMDIDYGGDKGAFAMARIDKKMALADGAFFSWNKLTVSSPATYSMGLFSRVSPDGRYLAGTVNESSVFVMMDDPYFSQLFFPASGRLAVFDMETKEMHHLPGADSPDFVQTSPGWSPDGQTLAFAATPTDPGLVEKVLSKQVRNEKPGQNITELNKKYPVQFNIYTVPFNSGKGGTPLPLEGASFNGMSNYFPRFSPDGKWIVFTQSPTGLVLQPDSKLCIVPAQGGKSRYLASNLPVMNSWHSWSPNSRWMVFTCKATSPYTELYLTHIDEAGQASPALRLFRFSHNELAAMVPEFLTKQVTTPESIYFKSPDEVINMADDGR